MNTIIPPNHKPTKMRKRMQKSELGSTAADDLAGNDNELAHSIAEPRGLAKNSELTPALLEKLLTTTLRKEISELRSELLVEIRKSQSVLSSTVEDHENRISSLESALTEMSASFHNTEKQCASLLTENQLLRHKADDLENRSRRMNLRVVGIPEGSEQGRPTDFMSSFFATLFGESKLSRRPVIERAHRTLNPKPAPDRPPRAIIVTFHHFQMKEEIARLARNQQGKLSYKDSSIRIFPDLSADLARRRGTFREIKGQLYNAGIKFRHSYPSKLTVTFEGTDHTFEDPSDASAFFNKKIKPSLKVQQAEQTQRTDIQQFWNV